jgi:hypothetical protein
LPGGLLPFSPAAHQSQINARAGQALDAFPDRIPVGSDMPERKGFNGVPASKEIWDKFVGERGKRISNEAMKHIQFPIRYWNI